MTMPYYRTVVEENVKSLSGINNVSHNLQTRMFTEHVGFRSRPRKDGTVTPLKSGQAEPYSWLDDYNAIKARTFQSKHPELASLFKKDKGHVWDLATCDFSPKLASFQILYRNGSYITNTNVRPVALLSGMLTPWDLTGTANQLSSYSALEYGRTAPTSDEISMSAIIGELREGLPALIPAFLTLGSKRNFKSTLQRQTRRVRDAGSDYLNVQFGWIPLLSDVRKIATALAVATAAISGDSLATHRRRDKPEKDTTISGSTGAISFHKRHSSPATFLTTLPGTSETQGSMLCNVWVSQRHQIDYSFEAEFLRLPEGQKDYSSYLTKLDELMRWDITPMDLWQLAPWSWLVDWFFDIGGQLDAWNSATSNRILSLYAYGMRDERLSTTVIVSDIRGGNTSDYKYVGPSTFFTEIKARRRQRIKANPFGFTPDPLNQLSAGQLAILGALGLTKIRR
jgi:hypothetical protein